MKERFFTGLIIVLPLYITLLVVSFLISAGTTPFISLVAPLFDTSTLLPQGFFIFSHDTVLHFLSIICILISIFFVLFCIGLVSRLVFIRYVLHALEKGILSLPLVNKVYKACHDFTHIIFSQQQSVFSQVVWAPFPTNEQKSLGLLTNKVELKRKDGTSEELSSILIPSTPNPTVGFLCLCKDVHATDLSLGPSVKWIVSCGSSETKTIFQDLSK